MINTQFNSGNVWNNPTSRLASVGGLQNLNPGTNLNPNVFGGVGSGHLPLAMNMMWMPTPEQLLELLGALLDNTRGYEQAPSRPQASVARNQSSRPAPRPARGRSASRTAPQAKVRSRDKAESKRASSAPSASKKNPVTSVINEEKYLTGGKVNGIDGSSYNINRRMLATRKTADEMAARLKKLSPGAEIKIIDQSQRYDGIFKPDTPMWEIEVNGTAHNAGLVNHMYDKYPPHIADQMMRDQFNR